MAKKLYRNVPIPLLRELLNYDPETGELKWRRRSIRHFPSHNAYATWNARYAGKPAGAVQKTKNRRYRNLGVFDYTLLAHRVCWAIHYGEWPDEYIDHIDGDGLNNRISNLRVTDQFHNMRNSKLKSENTSGHVGVSWDKRRRKWHARIQTYGRSKHLGYFDEIEDAIAARQKAQKADPTFTDRHGLPAD